MNGVFPQVRDWLALFRTCKGLVWSAMGGSWAPQDKGVSGMYILDYLCCASSSVHPRFG